MVMNIRRVMYDVRSSLDDKQELYKNILDFP